MLTKANPSVCHMYKLDTRLHLAAIYIFPRDETTELRLFYQAMTSLNYYTHTFS